LGLILAIGTAVAVFIVIRSMQAEPVEPDLEEVVVAVQPIAEEEPVVGRIELRSVPRDYIPQGALRSLDGTEEMVAAGPIPQGTILHPDLLLTPAELLEEGELGRLVEPGNLAIAFPITELSSVSYGIQPGDHIDVLMTFFFVDVDLDTQATEPLCPPLCPGAQGQTEAEVGGQRPRLATQLTLQDIKVLGVGRWVQEETPAEEADNQARTGEQIPVELPEYITVEMTPQDALVLKLAREQGASIDLAVRAQDDLQTFTTQQVTLDYLLARFGVSVPTRQPYSIEFAFGPGSGE
jgi:pilus assembly protein CpaB